MGVCKPSRGMNAPFCLTAKVVTFHAFEGEKNKVNFNTSERMKHLPYYVRFIREIASCLKYV